MVVSPTRNRWLDRVAAAASAICVLHCAAVPFLFLLVPALTLSLRSWSDPHHGLAIALLATLRWERLVVAGALLIAAFSLIVGYRRHGRAIPLFTGMVGGALLLGAAIGGLDQPLWTHTTLMIAGGGLLSTAHIINLHAAWPDGLRKAHQRREE
jgi:MerC mercury resistance protein